MRPKKSHLSSLQNIRIKRGEKTFKTEVFHFSILPQHCSGAGTKKSVPRILAAK
jgi:hypothetical protein